MNDGLLDAKDYQIVQEMQQKMQIMPIFSTITDQHCLPLSALEHCVEIDLLPGDRLVIPKGLWHWM